LLGERRTGERTDARVAILLAEGVGAGTLAGALIVIAAMGGSDFDRLDSLRRHHYPPDRNHVPAHLTLFRSLPPSAELEVRRSLARAVSRPAPRAEIVDVMDLDSGVALRVRSLDLEVVRDELAEEFRGLLTAQDTGRWTAHVTIQNKVAPREARALLAELRANLEPRPLAIKGLELVRYADPKWEPVAAWSFR
jgi:hypothetical protein